MQKKVVLCSSVSPEPALGMAQTRDRKWLLSTSNDPSTQRQTRSMRRRTTNTVDHMKIKSTLKKTRQKTRRKTVHTIKNNLHSTMVDVTELETQTADVYHENIAKKRVSRKAVDETTAKLTNEQKRLMRMSNHTINGTPSDADVETETARVNDTKNKCNFCNNAFTSIELLYQHIRIDHSFRLGNDDKIIVDGISGTEADRLDVPVGCTNTGVPFNVILQGHGKCHRCAVCSKSFTSDTKLKNHLKTSCVIDSSISHIDMHAGVHCADEHTTHDSGNSSSQEEKLDCNEGADNCTSQTDDKIFSNVDDKLAENSLDITAKTSVIRETGTCDWDIGKVPEKCSGVESDVAEGNTMISAKVFNCEICDKVFTQKHIKIAHMSTHTNEKKYKCGVCNKAFTNSGNLYTHSKLHLKTKPFVCEHCNADFAQKLHLRTHQDVAIGRCKGNKADGNKISLQCLTCGKLLSSIKRLAQHKKAHERKETGVLECGVCGKDFKTTSLLNRHALVHSGVKDHMCDTCGISFSQKANLISHLLTHKAERPFVCSICSKRFSQKPLLKMHIKRVHINIKDVKRTITEETVHKHDEDVKCTITDESVVKHDKNVKRKTTEVSVLKHIKDVEHKCPDESVHKHNEDVKRKPTDESKTMHNITEKSMTTRPISKRFKTSTSIGYIKVCDIDIVYTYLVSPEAGDVSNCHTSTQSQLISDTTYSTTQDTLN